VTFPENYKATFTKYNTINVPDNQQVRYYYANDVAIRAARAGEPLPDGSMLFAEQYRAKLDADNKPVMGADGFFVADKIAGYAAMAATRAGVRKFRRCCATRTGTTPRSPRIGSRGRASTRPNASLATSRVQIRAICSR